MWKTIAAVLGRGAVIGAGVWMAVAAMSPRSAAAQQNLWAAVAVSTSTSQNGSARGDSQATVERIAIQSCQANGARDCKVVASVVNACVALASPEAWAPTHYGYGNGPTREGAAAAALADCTKGGGLDCVVRDAPCSNDNLQWASPLPVPPGGKPGSVDPALVGL